MDAYINITYFFDELLSKLKCQRETKSYIISIYGKYKSSTFDLSKDSITLLFAQARQKQDFLIYQNIGDYIFFVNTMTSNHFNAASKDYYDTLARLSYYSCYKIVDKKLKFYEEMSDKFITLEEEVKILLPKLI